MRLTIKNAGAFQNTKRFLKKAERFDPAETLRRYGEEGVRALAAATPKDTGDTAGQWRYAIRKKGAGRVGLYFCNDHVNDGANVAVLLQYGHGTGTGGYVQGIDYINPALRPVFEKIAEEAWKELMKA